MRCLNNDLELIVQYALDNFKLVDDFLGFTYQTYLLLDGDLEGISLAFGLFFDTFPESFNKLALT